MANPVLDPLLICRACTSAPTPPTLAPTPAPNLSRCGAPKPMGMGGGGFRGGYGAPDYGGGGGGGGGGFGMPNGGGPG